MSSFDIHLSREQYVSNFIGMCTCYVLDPIPYVLLYYCATCLTTTHLFIIKRASKKPFHKDYFIRQLHTQQTFHHNQENKDSIIHDKTMSDVSDFAVLLFRAAKGGYTNNLTWLRSMLFQKTFKFCIVSLRAVDLIASLVK